MDKDTRISLEYDFYGGLLTKRQRDVMHLHHEENLSLSEIAQEFGISRQGVHDALKNAQESLDTYEAKLGLVQRFEESARGVSIIDEIIDRLLEKNYGNEGLTEDLKRIKSITDGFNE